MIEHSSCSQYKITDIQELLENPNIIKKLWSRLGIILQVLNRLYKNGKNFKKGKMNSICTH